MNLSMRVDTLVSAADRDERCFAAQFRASRERKGDPWTGTAL